MKNLANLKFFLPTKQKPRFLRDSCPTAPKTALKLGERGCFIYDGIHCTHVAPVEIGTAVDTTAAGDAFTAALTYMYCENGGDIVKACEFANMVGAYVVTNPGAFSSLPTRKELEEFAKCK